MPAAPSLPEVSVYFVFHELLNHSEQTPGVRVHVHILVVVVVVVVVIVIVVVDAHVL